MARPPAPTNRVRRHAAGPMSGATRPLVPRAFVARMRKGEVSCAPLRGCWFPRRSGSHRLAMPGLDPLGWHGDAQPKRGLETPPMVGPSGACTPSAHFRTTRMIARPAGVILFIDSSTATGGLTVKACARRQLDFGGYPTSAPLAPSGSPMCVVAQVARLPHGHSPRSPIAAGRGHARAGVGVARPRSAAERIAPRRHHVRSARPMSEGAAPRSGVRHRVWGGRLEDARMPRRRPGDVRPARGQRA